MRAFPIPRPEPLAEALGLFGFVMLSIWKLQLQPMLAVVILAATFATHAARGETRPRLGFAWKNFRAALPLAAWAAAAAVVFLAAGWWAGTTRRMDPSTIALGLAAYLVWGLVQQYLLNAFLANRLAEFAGSGGSRVALASAALFSLAHLPNWFLMAVTLVGGYLSVRAWQRYRNLYVLGIAHGLIAFSLYLAVPDSISAHFLIGPRCVAYNRDVLGGHHAI